jgi:uncharacterized membrane protein YhaH (DUF805 family)
MTRLLNAITLGVVRASSSGRRDGLGQLFIQGVKVKFNEAVISAFRSFAVFKGRAGRSEFWYFVLFFCGGVLTAATIDILLDRTSGEHLGPITAIFILVSLLPYYAVSVRRLHDIDRSGWFALIGAIPIPGYILLIYWYCQPGSSGSNRFGSHVATTRPGEALASMTGSSTDVVTASPVTPTKSAKTDLFGHSSVGGYSSDCACRKQQ